MSQFNFGNLRSPLSGEDFVDNNLEPWRDALHSSHSGNSTPSYVVAGMVWVDTTTTPWIINMYDGAQDVAIGTLNASTHAFKPTLTSLSADITNAMLAQMDGNTVKVRANSAAGAPQDLSMGSSTILARLAAGDIVAASVSQIKTLLAIAISDTTGTVGETRGGTNQTTYTQGDILYASASNTLSKLAKGAVGQRLGMSSTIPQWEYDYIPQNSKSAAYTLVAADAGAHIFHPSADTTARIWTIPANASVAFPIGTAITFINQNGAGVITIAITSDTMRLAGAGTTGSRTLAANGIATAVKVTSTEWIISGTGLT